MSERDPRILVSDMLEAIGRIRAYTEGMSFDEFRQDKKTSDAVLRNLQVLGEAAHHVPEDVRSMAQDVEWTRIIRSRHIVVHRYFGVDFEIVWRIVEIHLTPRYDALSILLDEL